MRILYIDTSSNYLYAGIVEDDKCIAEIKEKFGQSLSEMTLPRIANLFEQAKLNPKEINKIIVVNGPGSFTGIRIGITIAKVYAWSLKIPITTITSLEAMAISSDSDCVHVPMIDARRGYVYTAIYDKNYQILLSPIHIKLTDLKNKLKTIEKFEVISNDFISIEPFPQKYTPNIIKIVNFYKNKKDINPHFVNPEYLKLTEAEEKHDS